MTSNNRFSVVLTTIFTFIVGFVAGAALTLFVVQTLNKGVVPVPVAMQGTELGAAIQAAQAAAGSTEGQCPRSDELVRFTNEYNIELSESMRPHDIRSQELRSIWRRFNRDSMLSPRGYELWELLTLPENDNIYTQCTGQAPPPLIDRIPDGHQRLTCYGARFSDVRGVLVIPEDNRISVNQLCEDAFGKIQY